MTAGEALAADYRGAGLATDRQPMELIRPALDRERVIRAAALGRVRPGTRVKVAGVVIVRQHPPTAKGFTFLTLEDETGFINLILRPQLFAALRPVIHQAAIVLAVGRVQQEKDVVNVQCETLRELHLGAATGVEFASRDFH